MSIKAINVTRTHPWTYEGDTDENPTVFRFRALTSREMAWLRDRNMEIGGSKDGGKDPNSVNVRMNTSGTSVDMFSLALCGVENFIDDEGNEIAFDTEVVVIGGRKVNRAVSDLVDRIPFTVITSAALKIRELSTLSEEEVKN